MDDDLANRWIRVAYKLGYHRGQHDKHVEQLHYDHNIVRWARAMAWTNHDITKVKVVKGGQDVTCPDEWPPGVNEDEEVERFVLEKFPEAKTVYGDDYDEHVSE